MRKNSVLTLIIAVVIIVCTACSTHSSKVQKGMVVRHIDGDTVVVKIGGEEEKVRFIGINCPEYTKKKERYGKEASEYTKKKLLNKTVYLEFDKEQRDKYKRILAYVYLTDNAGNISQSFNAELVKVGLARCLTIKPNDKYKDVFSELNKRAKRDKLGMYRKAS